MNLKETAFSRIAEPLSKGINVKKLLELHISPYINQTKEAQVLLDLKNIDKTSSMFLEWFGVLKGLRRPKTTINNEELNDFFNVFNPDNFGFSDMDISKPMYFNQKNYFEVGDLEFKRIIKAYCELTGFKGTVDEYSYFFREIFGVDVYISVVDFDLELIVENTNQLTIDDILIYELTPIMPQTKNYFFQSPYQLFAYSFTNMTGTKMSFDENTVSSFYFSF